MDIRNEKGGRPMDIDRAKAALDRAEAAQKDCSICGMCGNKLPPDAPIWRERNGVGYAWGRWHARVAPVCKDCASLGEYWQDAKPCEGCGRPVHTKWWRKRVLCCDRCRQKANAGSARAARAKERGENQTCIKCSKVFTPRRSDAQFCSNACRQSAYRWLKL
jgi:hypothetical protein